MDQIDNLTKRLFLAYYSARRHKRNTKSALQFELNLEANIFKLRAEIMANSYRPLPPICFIVNKPVKREVFAADFRDRVVHHLIFDYINPLFERLFIADAYSCRIGKGTSYGVARVEKFLRQATAGNQTAYVLKLDISGYFMGINHQTLYQIIEREIDRHKNEFDKLLPIILNLIKLIIFQNQTLNCRLKGDRKDWLGLPRDKSLFGAKAGTGLPIGNLTSQLFANVYLNDFDQFVKRTLKIKCYGRYVDDMVFVDSDRSRLQELIPVVREYLQAELDLKLHPKKIKLVPASGGLLFLGVYIKPTVKLIGCRTKSNFYQLVRDINARLKNKNFSSERINKARLQINSYLGVLGQVCAGQLKRKIIDGFDKGFYEYFWVAKNIRKAGIKKTQKLRIGYKCHKKPESSSSRQVTSL